MVKIFSLSLFLISLSSLGQDSLLLVKKSRVLFCVQQAQTVRYLNERILVKDSVINVKDSRLEVKDTIINSLNRDIATYKVQQTIKDSLFSIQKENTKYYKDKYRKTNSSLRKAKLGQWLLGGLSIFLAIRSF